MKPLKIKQEDINKLFFISDLHLRHKNVIQYSNRPFKSLEEMEKTIIDNWNRVVPKDGIVFLMGDFIFSGNIQLIKSYLDKLNGTIHFILGNHDYRNKLYRDSILKLFASANDLLLVTVEDDEMDDGKQDLFLSHYPLLSWYGSNQGSWNLFGHIHSGPNSNSSDRLLPLKPTQYDVGVDNNNYTPASYQYIKTQLTRGRNDTVYTMNYYLKKVNGQLELYPYLRVGQVYFNVLHELFPKVANELRGTKLDPYYNLGEDSLRLFIQYIHKYFKDDNI